MDLQTILTGVQARGYETDTATVQIVAINSAYRRLCGEHHWPWLEASSTSLATVAGTASYALSGITDLVHVDSVRIATTTEFYDLEYMEPEELQELLHLNRENNIPDYWTIQEGSVFLYPRPARVYTITVRYIKDPPDLAANGDTPIFPATYHDILIYGALAELAARERDWNQHDRWRAQYDELVHRMKAQLGIRQRQNAQYIVRSGLYDDNTIPTRF